MSDALDEVAEEVFGDSSTRGNFRPKSEDRVEHLKEAGYTEYEPERDTAISLEQAKRLSEYSEYDVFSTVFDDDSEVFDIVDELLDEFPHCEVKFAGSIAEIPYLDAMYVFYDQPTSTWEDEFEEWAILHFKHEMSADPEENHGICPLCTNGISIYSFEGDVVLRDRRNDEHLVPADEFSLRESEERGKYLRLWWDD